MDAQTESLWNGIVLKRGPFPLGTDSVLLSHFVSLRSGCRIADLGAGCGTLGLLLAGGTPPAL